MRKSKPDKQETGKTCDTAGEWRGSAYNGKIRRAEECWCQGCTPCHSGCSITGAARLQSKRSTGSPPARGRLRGQGHPTTTLRRCSDNPVAAHMQRSDASDTKRCEEPKWFRKKREQLYTELMRISHLLEQPLRQARGFPVVGDNEDAR